MTFFSTLSYNGTNVAALLFYLGCFFTSFFLCIPIGPVNLEVFQSAIKKASRPGLEHRPGRALGDAIWAMAAFFGISPFLKNGYNILH